MLTDLIAAEKKPLGIVPAGTVTPFGTAGSGDPEEKVYDRQHGTSNQERGNLPFVVCEPPTSS